MVPPTSASSIARPKTPSTSEATQPQLAPGVLQHLVQPLGLTAALLDLRLAVAGQLAQLPDRPRRHEAGADQPVLDQLGDPGRIGHVGLAAGRVLEVLGVHQPALDVVFQQVVDRLPEHPGRLHPHHLDLVAGQPVPQQHQPGGGGPKTYGSRCAARPPPSGIRTHALTEALCTSSPAQRSMNLSTSLLLVPGLQACRPEEPHHAESGLRARSNSPGPPRLPRPTDNRAQLHQAKPTSPGDRAIFSCAGVGRQTHDH